MDVAVLWMLIVTTSMGSGFLLRSSGRAFRLPWLTIILAAMTFTTSALGNVYPGFLDVMKRDGSRLADGQVWRIITPLLVQDGGWTGTIFNISTLLVLGAFAESLSTRRAYALVYIVAGVVSEAFAYTLLQHQGFAGNSVAVLGIAGLLSVTCVRSGSMPARIAGTLAMLAGLGLIVMSNLHGVGFAVGALASTLITPRHVAPSTSGPVASNGC